MGCNILAWSSLLLLPPPVWDLRPLKFSWKAGMEDILLAGGAPDVTMNKLLIRVRCNDSCISQETRFCTKRSFWGFKFTPLYFPCNCSTWLTSPSSFMFIKLRVLRTSIKGLGRRCRNISNKARIHLMPINYWNIWSWILWNMDLGGEEITYITLFHKDSSTGCTILAAFFAFLFFWFFHIENMPWWTSFNKASHLNNEWITVDS